MRRFYTFFIYTLVCVMRFLACTGNQKIKKGLIGRRKQHAKIAQLKSTNQNTIWIHAASVGEYEQARVLANLLRQNNSSYRLLFTFFSPSGYEKIVRENNEDLLFYLPFDTPARARHFIDCVNPALVIFVKYELWWNVLHILRDRNTPSLLICARAYPQDFCFRFYGFAARAALRCFSFVLTQDEQSSTLFQKIISPARVKTMGDTRIDRTIEIAENYAQGTSELAWVNHFKQDKKLLVAGSTWAADHDMLCEKTPLSQQLFSKKLRLLIVPHELNKKEMQRIKECMGQGSALLSSLNTEMENFADLRVIIVDKMGLLARLYAYADMVYVGGGWREKGLHNVMEPAAYGKPILIARYFSHFKEVADLVACKGVVSLASKSDFYPTLSRCIYQPDLCFNLSRASKNYTRTHSGASRRIADFIYEKRLLTNCKK